MKARIEFEPRNLWVGVYWRRIRCRWICDDDQSKVYNALLLPREVQRLHVYLCLVPCFPLHIVCEWGERLLTEEETIADMLALGDD